MSAVDERNRILIALPDRDRVTVHDALAHQQRLLVERGVTSTDARAFVVREHYFKTEDAAVAAADRLIDRRFEAAADAIVAGDATALGRLLADDPQLARARSAYGHRQTLLHHVSANGIEWARQWQTPPNAAELARMLLAAGAEPDVTCESYSKNDTALTLLASSCHPAEAGVQGAIVEALVAGGAAADGPAGDSDPLWTALTWGYQDAVDALVRCGARTDNLVLAAASGDVARLREQLAAPRVPVRIGGSGKVIAADQLVEHALIYAASLDRRDVVVELLALDPDLRVAEPLWGATALGAASHEHPSAGRPHGNPAIVELLSK
jgi:hypothetical protein